MAIAGGLAGNTQTYNWLVPANIAPSRLAVIRVTATDAAGNAQSASSGLISLIGSGFTANSTATYTYDCSAAGGSGNFIADMETPNQSSLSSDDQSIANALGAGGTATTTLYPTDTGQNYYLSVNSECSWSVTLTAG